jgi:DNA-binding Lrp family transcriptional regulator
MVLPGRPGFRPSDREMAKKLNIPAGTLRYRIRRMYSSGVLTGSSVFPNPNLLGLKAGAYTLDLPNLNQKPEAVSKLKRVSGGIMIHNFIGSLVWIVFVYENDQELSKKLDQMKEAAGVDGVFSRIPYPPCSASLTRQQAELLLYLTKHGLSSYGELAKKLGVSVRTAERRLSYLTRNASLVSLPRVNYSAMAGCVPADLLVFFKDMESVRAAQPLLLSLLGDQLILAALWDVVGMCSLVMPNVASVSELAERVKLMEGVVLARVDIVKEHIDMAESYGRYIESWMMSKGFLKARRLREEDQGVSVSQRR